MLFPLKKKKKAQVAHCFLAKATSLHFTFQIKSFRELLYSLKIRLTIIHKNEAVSTNYVSL